MPFWIRKFKSKNRKYMEVKLWKYRNYKWNEYEVVCTGFLTENKEEVVIYKQHYESDEFPYWTLWVRKKQEFIWIIEVQGSVFPRFTYID